jgi:hypothetical protein
MPIIAAGQRRYLLEKSLLYLFSYDVPLARGNDTLVFMPVPGGVRLETYVKRPTEADQRRQIEREDAEWGSRAAPPTARERAAAEQKLKEARDPGPWAVYHVLDDITVEDNDAITGAVRMVRDWVFLPTGDKFGAIEGSLVIETDDDAVIDSRYKGCLSVGSLGIGHFDESAPEEKGVPTRAKLFIAPRFETAYPKYKWLTERQCAGFGLVDIEDGVAVRATIDIYALKSETSR